jgi:hypothetical protein
MAPKLYDDMFETLWGSSNIKKQNCCRNQPTQLHVAQAELGRGGGAQVSRANLLVARGGSARTSYARAARPGVKARANYLCVRASQYDLYFFAFEEPYQVRASLNPLDSARQPHVGVLQARRK